MNGPWPEAVAHLPVCPVRHLPIPASSARDPVTGAGEFGTNDPAAKLMCALAELCGVCGRPLGDVMVFLALDKLTGADPARLLFTDPPMHEPCLAAALQLCPFIARPRLQGRVRPGDKPGWLMAAAGSYELGPGRGSVLFTFRPGPLLWVRRLAYDAYGRLTEVAGSGV